MGQAVVSGLLPEYIPVYRDQLRALIDKPLKRTGADKYYTSDHVLEKCLKREWQCWVACSQAEVIDCAFITFISDNPTGYNEFNIHLVGGKNLHEWLPIAWGLFKNFAKARGCKAITGGGRAGWVKALNKVEPNKFESQYSFTVEI